MRLVSQPWLFLICINSSNKYIKSSKNIFILILLQIISFSLVAEAFQTNPFKLASSEDSSTTYLIEKRLQRNLKSFQEQMFYKYFKSESNELDQASDEVTKAYEKVMLIARKVAVLKANSNSLPSEIASHIQPLANELNSLSLAQRLDLMDRLKGITQEVLDRLELARKASIYQPEEHQIGHKAYKISAQIIGFSTLILDAWLWVIYPTTAGLVLTYHGSVAVLHHQVVRRLADLEAMGQKYQPQLRWKATQLKNQMEVSKSVWRTCVAAPLRRFIPLLLTAELAVAPLFWGLSGTLIALDQNEVDELVVALQGVTQEAEFLRGIISNINTEVSQQG